MNFGTISQREVQLLSTLEETDTERVLNSSVKRTAGPEVIRRVHKAVYFFVVGTEHHTVTSFKLSFTSAVVLEEPCHEGHMGFHSVYVMYQK